MSARTWLLDEIAAGIAASIEGLTGARPSVSTRELPAEPPAGAIRWRQPFSGISGAIWIQASEADSSAIGAAIARAAEIEETDPEKLKSEVLEIVRQALSAVAQSMTGKLDREIVCDAGAESDAPAPAVWSAIEIHGADYSATFSAGIEPAIETSLDPPPEPPKSKNYDLLLDVELPVSVSFGRAHVALKDVLKLTTGSIVELNRDVADPVEIIVNNCVIARGEVVVVEGNFGVRIQQVISRQERIRTLP
jgi:flagellar motor switch protein FliN